jgi:hypothetical protein
MARFTADNARAAGLASVAARAAIKAARILESQRPPPPPPFVPPPLPADHPAPKDAFTQARLERVRVQIARIDALLADEDDPKRLKELADALGRLADQERILAGRPLPGSRRPEKDKPARTFTPGAWLDLSAPAQVARVEAPRLQDPAPACASCASDTTTGSVLPNNPMPSMPQDAAKP